MCGISGYYGFPKNKKLLQRMNNTLKHRGPDGEGYYYDDKVGLAHRRLAILDKQGGAEPMFSKDKKYVLIYNGEIYNYKILKKILLRKGYQFFTNTDTEVVLLSYIEWKYKAFDLYDGMFALALYDNVKKSLILARDHFGIKPLYYTNLGSLKNPRILFGSEIKSILSTNLFKATVNNKVIYKYLKYRIHDDSSNTFFKNIYKLMPGEAITLSNTKDKNKQSFYLKNYTNLKKDLYKSTNKIYKKTYNRQSIHRYKNLLIKSIKLRVESSDFPVGIALSGGLDSSSVYMIIYKYLMNIKNKSQNNKKIFSAVFPNSINDESKYIETILETIDNDKFKFYKVFPKFTNFIKDLEDFVFYQEEPIISSGPYAQYSLMKKASKYVKVMLDGQGADETMAGYNPYYITYLNELIKNRKIFTFIKEAISSFDICINLFKFHFISLINKHKIKKINMMLNKEFLNKYSNYSHKIINNNLKLRLINDIFHQSLPAVLRYEDKNTMRFSIEGRLPFLSKDLVKYLFTLSNEAIIKNGWNKRILRDSLNDILPKKIVKRRKKIGFTTPETDWFINCKKTFYKIFLSKSFAMRPYWNRDNILRIYEEYLSGNNQISTMYFWRIINTELWLRKFIDIKKSKNSKDINNKMEYQPNKGKNIYITFTDHHKNSRLSVIKTYLRFPIKTKVFYQHTNLYNEILKYVNKFFINFNKKFIHIFQANPWYLFVSEKIVSITQGRSIPIWDIKVSYIARILSKYVHQSKFGIGIGSPWSMQLAIQESGVLRLIFSALIGRLLKMIGFKGVFYKLVGKNINSIDGPACYQVGTSIYSAKLPPENPHQIATNISNLLRKNIPIKYIKNFSGSVIIDANDIGSEILGQDTDLSDKDLKMIFSDNPQGQTSETTPISIVFQRK